MKDVKSKWKKSLEFFTIQWISMTMTFLFGERRRVVRQWISIKLNGFFFQFCCCCCCCCCANFWFVLLGFFFFFFRKGETDVKKNFCFFWCSKKERKKERYFCCQMNDLPMARFHVVNGFGDPDAKQSILTDWCKITCVSFGSINHCGGAIYFFFDYIMERMFGLK